MLSCYIYLQTNATMKLLNATCSRENKEMEGQKEQLPDL
jgi:hypothetical protein